MTARIIVGDVTESLRTLPDESVHCVVTSPPYWGLRDYGTGTWEGGEDGCGHTAARRDHADEKQSTSAGTSRDRIVGDECRKCGATRIDRQLGLEKTPEEYVSRMVDVFREVRRVLRSDGTAWVNMGDSYASSLPRIAFGDQGSRGRGATEGDRSIVCDWASWNLKEKQLVGMPWRLAFALQADGWWLRSDIIWSKPNPMPESVTDRPTKAHEYLFLLTKSARYYYDADAVREAAEYGRRDWSDVDAVLNTEPGRSRGLHPVHRSNTVSGGDPSAGRNLRTVWTIATEPFPEAHFATFPRALVEPCIKAGTSERGACPECGAGWERKQERGDAVPMTPSDAGRKSTWTIGDAVRDPSARMDTPLPRHYRPVLTESWRATCACAAPTTQPATVLDPFAGSGTTGAVALSLGRDFIGIELNPTYAEMARGRLENVAPLLGETTVAAVEDAQAEMFGG